MGEAGAGLEPFMVRFYEGSFSPACAAVSVTGTTVTEVLIDWVSVIGGSKSASLGCDLLAPSVVRGFLNTIHSQAAGLIHATTDGMNSGEIYLQSTIPLFPVLFTEEMGLPCMGTNGWPLSVCGISNLWDGINGNEDSPMNLISGLCLEILDSDLPGTTPTPTFTRTQTLAPSRTNTQLPTATSTLCPTVSATSSPLPTSSLTLTRTQSPASTSTPTYTNTNLPSQTPTQSHSASMTPTRTNTRTSTPSPTATPKKTATPTPTKEKKVTPTPTNRFTYNIDTIYDYDKNGKINLQDLIAIWNAGWLQPVTNPVIKADSQLDELPERRVLLFELSLNWGKEFKE
jgi:hypothetical protein